MNKKITFLVMAFALFLLGGKAQAQCPAPDQWGEVALSSQAEVNQFIIDYPNCTEIEGYLLIGSWDEDSDITDLSPLSNLISVEDHFLIYGNLQLTSLSGLNNLTSINGLGYLQIIGNPQLTSLTGLEGLTSLVVLDIQETYLTSLSGLENLISVGIVSIFNNNQLTDISALQNIDPATIIGTDYEGLAINDNPLLEVCSLPNFCIYLQDLGWRYIENNAGNCIDEQAVLNACLLNNDCPEGDVILTSQNDVNAFLTNYPNCTEIENNLYLGYYVSNNISDLLPLSNLTSVGGLYILGTQLTSLSELENLTSVGDIEIWDNNALVSLSGLENLTTLESLGILDNNALTTLSGLDNLVTASNSFGVFTNNSLTSFAGLENLTFVGVTLAFGEHNSLTDIFALQNIEPTFNFLEIYDNPLLSVCNLSNLCTYLQNEGESYIENNAGNCIDEQAVLNACSLSVKDTMLNEITVYPNPVKDILHFSTEIQKITVTDLTGKVITTQTNSNQVDLSNFQTGVYFVAVEQENGAKETRKVIKP